MMTPQPQESRGLPGRTTSRRARLALALSAAGLLAAATTCGGDPPPEPAQAPSSAAPSSAPGDPPTAQRSVHEQFLADLAAPRSPADGGGAVRLVLAAGEDGSVRAGGYGRWSFEYTAGEHGIAPGGALLLLVPPFWGWSTPQAEAAGVPGFTTAQTDEAAVRLELATVDRNLLRIGVEDAPLPPGATVRIVYGASEALAKADDYAEARSPFWFKVDGDGDGVSALVEPPPTIEVLCGPPARLVATLDSIGELGREAHLTLAVLDAVASSGVRVEGRVHLASEPPGLGLPEVVELEERDRGLLRIPVSLPEPGLFRVVARLESEELEDEVLSNPLRVGRGLPRVLWGDLHGHSSHSDGTGTPEAYYAYARDAAGLDFAVLTDHDHFGVRFLDASPDTWEEIRATVERFDEPGRFVALLGYEWTSWLYGHRHVVHFDGEGEVLSSVGGSTTTPRELWDALEGRPALTFAHHSAGGPVATDWSFEPDPVLEPLTEVMSVHGSSEAQDSPSVIRGGAPGRFVRDQLERGLRLGFVGSGDGHDGHPGHAHLSPFSGYRRSRPDPAGRRPPERLGNGGLAAVRASRLDAPSLLEAFRARRTYATSGPRILLRTSLEGHEMGRAVPADGLSEAPVLVVSVAGTDALDRVEVVVRGAAPVAYDAEGRRDVTFQAPLGALAPGDFVYVRVVQSDGGLAWSSPCFVE